VGQDGVVGIETHHRLDGLGIKSRWEEIFHTHPASYTMGKGHSWGVKQLRCGVDHPPPSRAEVKEKVQLLYLFSYVPSW
jgi:hypothetical protein